MKALLFLARTFSLEPFAATIPDADPDPPSERIGDAVVVFLQCEEADEERRASVLRRTLKQIKWLAGKREFKRVVLHSFTHLSRSKATAEFARAFLEELAGRLRSTGYEVTITPFGYTCSWNLDVYGETLAKVFFSV